MKHFKDILTRWTRDKDGRMPLSRLAGLWDAGRDILGLGERKGRPGNAYGQVDTVWACVNLLLDVSLQTQLMLSTADDQIIEDGPVYAFLFNNKQQPWRKFLTETLGFYVLFREVYWVTVEADALRPTRLLVVGPRQMEPIDKDGVLVGYKMRSGNKQVVLDVDDVFCMKNFNPSDALRGLGPIEAGSLSISLAYQSAVYSEASLANGARLSTILNLPAGVQVSDEERAKLKAEFRSQNAGAMNAAKVFLATGGIKVDTVSQTMADLQMLEMTQYTDKKICSLFGVPPECIGLNTEAQYAAGPATQRLILYVVAPLLSAFAEAIDDGIIERYRFTAEKNKSAAYGRSKVYCGQPTPLGRKAFYRRRKMAAVQGAKNVFCWFDIDSHPAIQEMLQNRTEKMLPFVDRGIPLEQIVAAGDLPFDTSDLPWAKEWWVSAGLMPARWILDGGMEQVTGPSLPEGEGEEEPEKHIHHEGHEEHEEKTKNEIDRQKADRVWKKYVASWRPLEKEFQSALRTYLRRQKAELVKKLEAEVRNQKSEDRVKNENDQIIARVVFDLKSENQKLRMIHKTFFERAAKLGAAQIAADAAGQTAEAIKDTVEQVIRRQALRQALVVSAERIQAINKTTARRVAETLREGLAAGEGLPDLRKRLESDLSFSTDRAQRIARTHTGSAVSAGRHEAAKVVGAKKKFWLTSKDDAVRKSHRQAESDHKDGIGIDEAFKVGGDFLLYPGDPGGSPANVVNCRCMELVKEIGGKSLTLDDYDRMGFAGYDAIKPLLKGIEDAC